MEFSFYIWKMAWLQKLLTEISAFNPPLSCNSQRPPSFQRKRYWSNGLCQDIYRFFKNWCRSVRQQQSWSSRHCMYTVFPYLTFTTPLQPVAPRLLWFFIQRKSDSLSNVKVILYENYHRQRPGNPFNTQWVCSRTMRNGFLVSPKEFRSWKQWIVFRSTLLAWQT